MPRGKFVVIDGGEGSGKSTLISKLKERYPEVFFAREPGGVKTAEAIRRLLLETDEGKNFNPTTQLLLFFAARSELLEKSVSGALNSGQNVICDRFDSSTFAYQVCASKHFELEGLFWSLRRRIIDAQGLRPDLYLFLDIAVEVGLQRRKGSKEAVNHMDEKPLEYHHGVRIGMRRFLRHGVPSLIVDATQSPQKVSIDCIDAIDTLFSRE